jgi:hydroxymethylbilane synthase
MASPLRIGTRGSQLALWQANFVADTLRQLHPGLVVNLVTIQTSGDLIQNVPLVALGGQGAFTKEIQKAVQDNQVDVAVHSLKDLPTFAVDNLTLGAVPARGPVGDAFVSKKHSSFAALPAGAVVATSSLRRRAQILHRRPDLTLVDMRGNVETRLRKLVEQDLDALILAEAGLVRLGREAEITEILDSSWMLPAVGQGALGLECREDDAATLDLLQPLNDPATRHCALAERAMLRGLGGGCEVPIGAATTVRDGQLTLRGVVLAPDGTKRIDRDITGPLAQGETLGLELAKTLWDSGAGQLLDG